MAFVFNCQNPPFLGLTFLGLWVALGVYWINFPWSVQQPFFQLRIRLTGRWMKFPVWMEFDKEERIRRKSDKSADSFAESCKNQGFCPVVPSYLQYIHYLQYLDLSLRVLNGWCLGVLHTGSNSTLWKMRACCVFGRGWSQKIATLIRPTKQLFCSSH